MGGIVRIGALRLRKGLESAGVDTATAENAAAEVGEMYVYVSKLDARIGMVIALLIAILAVVLGVGVGIVVDLLSETPPATP